MRVMMITGDSKATATAIARDVNIFTQQEYQDEEDRLLLLQLKAGGENGDENGDGGDADDDGGDVVDVRSYGRAFTGSEFFNELSEEKQMAILSQVKKEN